MDCTKFTNSKVKTDVTKRVEKLLTLSQFKLSCVRFLKFYSLNYIFNLLIHIKSQSLFLIFSCNCFLQGVLFDTERKPKKKITTLVTFQSVVLLRLLFPCKLSFLQLGIKHYRGKIIIGYFKVAILFLVFVHGKRKQTA